MMESTPKFIQGIVSFTGAGYGSPGSLGFSYTVPADKRCQAIYLRAGNSSTEMVALLLMRDGKPMRYFPIGAKADSHVALAVVEDLEPDQKIEILIAAPEGCTGTIVLDFGLMEI
jgi:assimilatory nitrate reductase catalytic subunit